MDKEHQCCNPHGIHDDSEVIKSDDLRQITSYHVTLDQRLVVGNWWCTRCRKKTTKRDGKLQSQFKGSGSGSYPCAGPSTPLDDRVCCNPHGTVHNEGEECRAGLRQITASHVALDETLVVGNWWCTQCRKKTTSQKGKCQTPFRGAASGDFDAGPSIQHLGLRKSLRTKISLAEPSASTFASPEPETRKCINPYGIHDEDKKCETKTWREISDVHAARTGLKAGDIWCDKCRKASQFSVVKSKPNDQNNDNSNRAPESNDGLYLGDDMAAAVLALDCSNIKVPQVLHECSPKGHDSQVTPKQAVSAVSCQQSLEMANFMELHAAMESNDKCCDPYLIHPGQVITNGLRPIRPANVKLDSKLVVGEHWCTKCRKHFHQSFMPAELVKCHYYTHSSETCSAEVKLVETLSADERKALIWNSGLWEYDNKTIVCNEHLFKYVGIYKTIPPQNIDSCCNPVKVHHSGFKVTTKLFDITLSGLLRARAKNVFLIYGEKYCETCRDAIFDMESQIETPLDRQDSAMTLKSHCSSGKTSTTLSPNLSPQILKQSVAEKLGVPVQECPSSRPGRVKAAKRQLEDAIESTTKKLCKSLAVSSKEIETDLQRKAREFDELMAEVKAKIPTASKSLKYQLLTLCPTSDSVRTGATMFGVSRRLFQTARQLREENGILAVPSFKYAPRVSEETKNLVVQFFCEDSNSKLLTGGKQCVSVERGVQYEQKRLLLCNLRELYLMFKAEYNKQVSFSHFCSLRPKWCVTAGAKNVHSVCVCQTHEDMKLLLHALAVKEHYRDLIQLCVCDLESRECMLGICEKCSKLDIMRYCIKEKVLNNLPSLECTEENYQTLFLEEKVEYKRWKSVDRTELLELETSRAQLIETAAQQLKKLIPHDYIARKQSEYLKRATENLTPQKAIVTMDFGMNYSCLIQGEIQSYHWSKKQVTIHPVCVVYKIKGDPELKSRTIFFISDDLDHDVYLVQAFQDKVIEILKKDIPDLEEVEYFSDGCVAQYKNKKSFLFLCEHQQRYNLRGKHNFFATSHGRSKCDAASAWVKRAARYASLQRPRDNQIISAKHLFEFCVSSSLNEKMHFEFISKENVDIERVWAKDIPDPEPVPGTRSYHQFIPLTGDTVDCRFTSFDIAADLIHPLTKAAKYVDADEGSFVVAKINRKKFLSYITDKTDENEVEVSVLHPKLPAVTFRWPDDLNAVIVPLPDILCVVHVSELPDNQYALTEASQQELLARRIVSKF